MTLTNAVLVLALGVATAFQPAAHHRGAGRWIVKPLGMSDPSEATANQDGVILKSNLERTKEGFESTDTPDFFDDEGEGGDIVDNSMSFTKGSQGGGSNHNPGVAGALDVGTPSVPLLLLSSFAPQTLLQSNPSWRITALPRGRQVFR